MPTLYHTRQEALALYDAGYWPVPCNGKVATKKKWQSERVPREELYDTLTNNAHLDAAIVLGPNKLVDIEYDTGPDGENQVLALFDGDIPLTPTWDSERGRHRLFRLPDGVTIETTKIGDVEIRTGSRLVVVPPSTDRRALPGLSLLQIEPAELPPNVVAKLLAAQPTPADATASTTSDQIAEGGRNDALYRLGHQLRGTKDWPEHLVGAALQMLNQRCCKPPLSEAEVEGIARSVCKNPPEKNVRELLLSQWELWHDKQGDAYATIPCGEHQENWKISPRNRAFRRILNKKIFDITGEPAEDRELAKICGLLEAHALEGKQHATYRRVGEHEGHIYIDRCDAIWSAIKVGADGWSDEPRPPVKFLRSRGALPLPLPQQPPEGETARSLLEPFVNVDSSGMALFLAALVAAMRPRGPFPVLQFIGEKGSGKTTGARLFQSVVDPTAAGIRAEPKSVRDFAIGVSGAWVTTYDNQSHVRSELADAFCRCSTGGAFAARALYTDDEEAIFEFARLIILTSITDITPQSDLLERSVLLQFLAIADGGRRSEKKFWSAFEEVRPYVLGALLNAVSSALAKLPEIEARENVSLSRMADFEQWAEAASEGLGLKEGEFAEAYKASREMASQDARDAACLIEVLVEKLKVQKELTGTATQLLANFELGRQDLIKKSDWPKNNRALSAQLKSLVPDLRAIGITAEQRKVGNEKIWTIVNTKWVDESTDTPIHKSDAQKYADGLRRTKGGK